MTSTPTTRINYVDGLRGIAALAVVLFHAGIRADLSSDEPLFRTLSVGRTGVDVFLVLSGFCLFFPLVRGGGPVQPLRTWDFLQRRTRRLAPPYYVALILVIAVSLAVYLAFGDAALNLQTVFPTRPFGFTANVIAHLLMLHGFDERSAHHFDGAFWSISLEWQFYLMFPLLAWIARRHLWLALALPIAVTVVYRVILAVIASGYLHTHSGNEIAPGRWAEFAAGMVVAVLVSRPAHLAWRQAVTVLSAVAVGVAVLWEVCWPKDHILPIIWSAGGAGLLWLAGAIRPLRWLLESDPAVSLGRASYSVYLVHGSVMLTTAAICEWIGVESSIRQPLILLSTPPLSVAGGFAFFWLIERHFLPTSLKRAAVEPITPK